jgi:hypothetical protein
MPLGVGAGLNRVKGQRRVGVRGRGFAGKELSAAWPPGAWQLEERVAWPFTHLFVAHER